MSSDPQIPEGLTREHISIYEMILGVVHRRKFEKKKPVNLIVITDLGKDYDGLLAMLVLKELDRLGVIRLLGFVANLYPAQTRARLGRGALDRLGLSHVPIAIGTKGEDTPHEALRYEFEGSNGFIAHEDTKLPEGKELLHKLFTEAKANNDKITFLGLSSLMDITQFIQSEYELVKAALDRVILQGGYNLVDDKLEADVAAANNNFAFKEAQYFHRFLQDNKIPSQCFTKVATFATPIYQPFLRQIGKSGVNVGEYLRAVQIGQDLHYWKCASGPREDRFRPFMDEKWFLKNKTTWYDKHPDEPGPPGKKIKPWLDKVTVYDCLAALGAAGEDVLVALDVIVPLKERLDTEHAIHKIVGVLPVPDPVNKGKNLRPEEANIRGEVFATAIQALVLGSLKTASREGWGSRWRKKYFRVFKDIKGFLDYCL